uniref:Uncharacterized protein n=1 Tax=Setaria viridis TaxID=4556 RepID=A0A4U6UM67_SETVI|nr:hypothetical protein SEVIR_5G313400v2 [Setaria viridis]
MAAAAVHRVVTWAPPAGRAVHLSSAAARAAGPLPDHAAARRSPRGAIDTPRGAASESSPSPPPPPPRTARRDAEPEGAEASGGPVVRQAGGQGRQEGHELGEAAEGDKPAAAAAALHCIGREGSPPPEEARILASLAAAAGGCFGRWLALRPFAGGLGPARRDLARDADAARAGRPGS